MIHSIPEHLTKLTLDYDEKQFPFATLITRLIAEPNLHGLQAGISGGRETDSLYKSMERSPVLNRLYSNLNGPAGAAFYATYHAFIRRVIYPLFEQPILYQSRPSHRILFADNPGLSRFHRDRDYGHNPREVNFQVAQTRARATNAMWIESAEGANDHAPVEIEPGRMLCFDGANLSHGAMVNTTGRSRVSFDFRVLPARFAEPGLCSQLPDVQDDNPIRANARNFSYYSP